MPENGFILRMMILRFPSCLIVGTLGTVLLGASCSPREDSPARVDVFAPQEAKQHVGEIVTVRGKVFGVRVSQKGDGFLNFGARFPDAPFTAVCFNHAIPADRLKELNGQTISVRGKIREYKGQIEIILETEDQILK